MVTRNKDKTEETEGSNLEVSLALDDDVARGLNTFQAAIAYFGDKLDNAGEVLGDGFTLTENKAQLVGVPLIVIDWEFIPGSFEKNENVKPFPGQGLFSTVRLITDKGDKYRISDGSTGIHRQLFEYSQRTGKHSGLAVKKGLADSHYSNEFTNDGVTYYLNTSA